MKVIITGGTGMIGRALARELVDNDHSVFILTRTPHLVKNLPPGVEALGWDSSTAQGWDHLVDGDTAIVNLAGANVAAGRWTAARKQEILQSRVEAGQAVVQAVEAASAKPAVVIQSSAVGYYGPSSDPRLTEKAPPGDDFLARVCVEWEASTAPVEAMGVRRAIIRTGIVLSAKDGALPRMLLPFKLFIGGPLGTGRQGFPWIHLADEVAAIRFLLEQPQASGAFNLAAPNPLSNADFGRALGRVLRRPAIVPTPALPLKLAFGEMASVLLEGQYAVPHRLQELGFQFRFSQAEAALQDLLR